MDHFRKLEAMYDASAVNGWFASTLEVGEGRAEVRMTLRNEFHHAAGAVHGAVYFKAMDDAAFFAANSIFETYLVLTAKFELTLLRPVVEGVICAKAEVQNEDEGRIYCEVTLFDESGNTLAKGLGAFARSTMPLTAQMGYC